MKRLVLLILLAAVSISSAQEFTFRSKASNVFIDNPQGPDTASFTISFDITAMTTDLWIELSAIRGKSADPDEGLNFVIENASNEEIVTGTVSAFVDYLSGFESNGYLRIQQGETARLFLDVMYTPEVTGTYRMQLYSWNSNTTMAPENFQHIVDGNTTQTNAHALQGVPEPSGALLSLVGGLACMARRKRSR